MYDKLFLILF